MNKKCIIYHITTKTSSAYLVLKRKVRRKRAIQINRLKIGKMANAKRDLMFSYSIYRKRACSSGLLCSIFGKYVCFYDIRRSSHLLATLCLQAMTIINAFRSGVVRSHFRFGWTWKSLLWMRVQLKNISTDSQGGFITLYDITLHEGG